MGNERGKPDKVELNDAKLRFYQTVVETKEVQTDSKEQDIDDADIDDALRKINDDDMINIGQKMQEVSNKRRKLGKAESTKKKWDIDDDEMIAIGKRSVVETLAESERIGKRGIQK